MSGDFCICILWDYFLGHFNQHGYNLYHCDVTYQHCYNPDNSSPYTIRVVRSSNLQGLCSNGQVKTAQKSVKHLRTFMRNLDLIIWTIILLLYSYYRYTIRKETTQLESYIRYSFHDMFRPSGAVFMSYYWWKLASDNNILLLFFIYLCTKSNTI